MGSPCSCLMTSYLCSKEAHRDEWVPTLLRPHVSHLKENSREKVCAKESHYQATRRWRSRASLCGWLCHDNSWRGSLGVAFLVLPCRIFTPGRWKNKPVGRVAVEQTRQSSFALRCPWVGPNAPANLHPLLHMFMTPEVPVGCRLAAKWRVGDGKQAAKL